MVDEIQNTNEIFFKPDAHYERTITRRNGTSAARSVTENYSYVFAHNKDHNYIFIKHHIFDSSKEGKHFVYIFDATDEAYNELLEGHYNYTRKNRGRCNVKQGHKYVYHAKIRYHEKDHDDGFGVEDTVLEKWIYHDVIEAMTFMQVGDLIDMDIDLPVTPLELNDKYYRSLMRTHMSQFAAALPPVPPYSDFLTYPNPKTFPIPEKITESEHFKTDEFPKNRTSHYHTIIDMSTGTDFEY